MRKTSPKGDTENWDRQRAGVGPKEDGDRGHSAEVSIGHRGGDRDAIASKGLDEGGSGGHLGVGGGWGGG